MTKQTIQTLIQEINTLCQAVENGDGLDLDRIEEHVENLSTQVTSMDISADSTLKNDLLSLDGMLGKLSSILSQVQQSLGEQMMELNGHKQALHAYARVANNNMLH